MVCSTRAISKGNLKDKSQFCAFQNDYPAERWRHLHAAGTSAQYTVANLGTDNQTIRQSAVHVRKSLFKFGV